MNDCANITSVLVLDYNVFCIEVIEINKKQFLLSNKNVLRLNAELLDEHATLHNDSILIAMKNNLISALFEEGNSDCNLRVSRSHALFQCNKSMSILSLQNDNAYCVLCAKESTSFRIVAKL